MTRTTFAPGRIPPLRTTDPKYTEIMEAVSRYGALRAAGAPVEVTDRAHRKVADMLLEALYPPKGAA